MPKPALPEKMTMRFDTGTFAAIDRLAGPGKRAAFIRAAVDEKIEAYARGLGIEAPAKATPYDKIAAGLNDAIAYAKGDLTRGRLVEQKK